MTMVTNISQLLEFIFECFRVAKKIKWEVNIKPQLLRLLWINSMNKIYDKLILKQKFNGLKRKKSHLKKDGFFHLLN